MGAGDLTTLQALPAVRVYAQTFASTEIELNESLKQLNSLRSLHSEAKSSWRRSKQEVLCFAWLIEHQYKY